MISSVLFESHENELDSFWSINYTDDRIPKKRIKNLLITQKNFHKSILQKELYIY